MLLGAIADDLTGATDLALSLTREGMRTIQVVGVPQADFDFGDAEAVVVALKSRTIDARDAVAMSVASARVLLLAGAEQLFFKYCSTFDSTPAGNIGPVTEALLDLLGAEFTIACPAFPTNGRTVYRGHLFVGQALLSESPMKDHPLTPMTDANLVRVLQAQTAAKVGLIGYEAVESGHDRLEQAFASARRDGIRVAIVDAVIDRHLRAIGQAFASSATAFGGVDHRIALHPRRAAWISTDLGTGVEWPAPIVMSAGIPTLTGASTNQDEVYVWPVPEVVLMAGPITFRVVFDWTGSGTLTARLIAHRYYAIANRTEAAIAKVVGTGLGAPSWA